MSEDERKAIGSLKLSSLLPDITSQALKNKSEVETRILLDWPHIVGKDLAQFSVPLKVSFAKEKRKEGTLHIKVSSGFATALQQLEPVVLEKIATYFGYQAVGKLKLLQQSFPIKEQKVVSPDSVVEGELDTVINQHLSTIEDPDLRMALTGLGKKLVAKKERVE